MFYILYSFLYVVSLLPFWFFYGLSDIAYFFFYTVFKYRVKVVRTNLQNSFPSKSIEEIKAIEKQFYHNLMDQMVETIKYVSLSEKKFRARYNIDWAPVLNHSLKHDKMQIWTGHIFNFEWINRSFQFEMKNYNEPMQKLNYLGVYASFKNKLAERVFVEFRTIKNSRICSTQEFKNIFKQTTNEINVVGLILDQNPSNPFNAYWYNFLSQKTAFYKTPENGVKKHDMHLFFAWNEKIKRGHYKGHVKLVTDQPNAFGPGELTKLYVQELEKYILSNPSMWLWSHRRWKHKFEVEEYVFIP